MIENEDTGENEPVIETESPSVENENTNEVPNEKKVVAQALGWKDKDEYRGRAEDWQDADAFLGRNAALKGEVEQLRERVSRQEETYAERIRRIEAANERIIREDRQRLVDELDRAQRSAVELGDIEEFDRLKKQEYDYYKRQAEFEHEQTRQPERRQAEPDLLPETQDWIRRNTWFKENMPMQQIALGFYNEAMEGMPANKDENKRLAYVEKRMGEVYPDKFGGGNKSNSVESGSRGMGSGSKITGLSPEERAACRKFIAKGIIKNEAEYIRYLNEYE